MLRHHALIVAARVPVAGGGTKLPAPTLLRYMQPYGAVAMKTVFALLMTLGALAVAACNTVEGAGRDISAGGEAVSDTARDVETEISQ